MFEYYFVLGKPEKVVLRLIVIDFFIDLPPSHDTCLL